MNKVTIVFQATALSHFVKKKAGLQKTLPDMIMLHKREVWSCENIASALHLITAEHSINVMYLL